MEKNDPVILEAERIILETIKQYARLRGVTQEEMAEKTGLLQSNIARIFAGKYRPKLITVLALAKALQMNVFLSPRENDETFNQAFEKAMESLGRRPPEDFHMN